MAFSRANRDNLLTLKANIQTDPRTLGFAGLFTIAPQTDAEGNTKQVASGDFRAISTLMSTPGGETIDLASISIGDLQGSVDPAEFEALADNKRGLWLSILQSTGGVGISATNANIRAQILSVWGAGTSTRTNLASLQSRAATEMEVLFGENASCTPQAVGRALNQE